MCDLNSMYENDNNFKEYVDKYSKEREIPKDVALTHMMVKEAAEMYSKYPKNCETKSSVQTINTCGC